MVVSIVNILNLEGGRKSYRAILKFIRTNLHRRVIAVVRPYIARAAIKDHGQGRMEWEGRARCGASKYVHSARWPCEVHEVTLHAYSMAMLTTYNKRV